MRKNTPLDSLLSKTVQGILATTMMRPEHWWYLSDLAKHLRRRPSSLQTPLTALVESGILRRRQDGNRVYFQPDPACPFFGELQGIITKTVGLVDVLRHLLDPFEKRITCAFIYGSVACGQERSESDIDLMVIGQATRFDLAKVLQEAERQLARPVNVSLYKPQEFAKRLAGDEHFLRAVLDREKLFVVGDEHDVERARKTTAGRKRTNRQV